MLMSTELWLCWIYHKNKLKETLLNSLFAENIHSVLKSAESLSLAQHLLHSKFYKYFLKLNYEYNKILHPTRTTDEVRILQGLFLM